MSTASERDARAVLDRIEVDIGRFLAMPDGPNGQVHSLFVGLYRETTRQWLAALDNESAPDFAYRVMHHFYALYAEGVPDLLDRPLAEVPRQWRRYHRLSRRLTMRSPISMHLLLISLGARAHIRHDLGIAIARAAAETARHGGDADLSGQGLIGALSQRAFLRAALDFVVWHRRRQSGWRRGVLTVYAAGLTALRPVWVPVMEGWRRAALADARPAADALQTGSTGAGLKN